MNSPPAGITERFRSRGLGALAVCSAAAALALGQAVQANKGVYTPRAMPWLTAAVILAVLGWILPIRAGRWIAMLILAAGIAMQIHQHMTELPMAGVTDPVVMFHFCFVALPILIAAAAGAILLPRWSRRIFIPLLLATHFITGVWLLQHTKRPFLDVYEETTDACQALSHGTDPYAITFPDIYAHVPSMDRLWKEAGTVANGRTQYGYQYMPLSLEVEWLGQLIAGDFRIANLLCVTLAGACMAYCRKGMLAPAAASLFLLTPRGYFFIEQGWSEPTALFCVAACTFLATKKSPGLPWTIGLMLVSKQYMILTVPAALLLLPLSKSLKPAIAAAVVTIPLVIWNIPAFWHSAIVELMRNPFRGDALNLAAAWVRAGHEPWPSGLAFVGALAAGGFVFFRAPRTPAGFAAALALILIVFFSLAKQAFGNYYFLSIAAYCSCVASSEVS